MSSFAHRLRVATLLTIAVAALSCGSDPLADGKISGVVVASGAVVGAHVRAYQLNDSGQKVGDLGDALTDATGAYTLDVGPGVDTLLLEVSGAGGQAYYYESSSGERVQLDTQVVLSAAVMQFQPNEVRSGVPITPLTTLAVKLAAARLSLGKHTTFTDAVTASTSLIGHHFLAGDVYGPVALDTLVPADPTTTAATSLTAELRYGFALAGMSRLAALIAAASSPPLNANSVNTLLLTQRLALDLSSHEALFDGIGTAGTLSLGSCAQANDICTITSTTPRSDLGVALIDFVNSSRNATHLAFADVQQLIESLSKDTDAELFPAGQGGTFDRDPPQIIFDAPTPDDLAFVRSIITVKAHAVDAIDTNPTLAMTIPSTIPDSDNANTSLLSMIDTRPMVDGPLAMTLAATDHSNNQKTVTRTYTVDNTAPVVVVTGVQNGAFYKNPVTPVIMVTEANPQSTTATLNGSSFTSGTTVSSDNAYALQVDAVDKAGNPSAPTQVVFTVDQSPPMVTVTKPAVPPNNYFKSTIEVEATAVDTNLSSLAVTAPPAFAAVPDDDPSLGRVHVVVPKSTVADGMYTISITATDRAGNSTTAMRAVVVDTQAPTLVVNALPQYSTTGTVTVSGHSTDNLSPITISIVSVGHTVTTMPDGGGDWTASFPLDASATCDTNWVGVNSITVTATDKAGNATSATPRTVTYDNCEATVSVVPTDGPGGVNVPFYDETTYKVAFRSTTYTPCLYRDGNTTTTTLAYDVHAVTQPTGPTVNKFAVNMFGAACTQDGSGWIQAPSGNWTRDLGNNISWYLKVDDIGSGVQSVKYQVKPPGGSFGALLPTVAQAFAGGANYRADITATVAPGLEATSGTWQVKLVITDVAGNVTGTNTVLWPIQWTHQVIGGPVYLDQSPTFDLHPPGGGATFVDGTKQALTIDDLTPLYNAAGNTIEVRHVKIFNGTPYETLVGVVVAADLKGTRDVNVRNVQYGTNVSDACFGGTCPACTSRYEDMTDSTCLPSAPMEQAPIPYGTACVSNGSYNICDASFVKEVRAYGAGQATCSDGSMTGPCASRQWKIDPRGTSVGALDVYLLTSKYTWLYDPGFPSFPGKTTVSSSSTTYTIWGADNMDWGGLEQYVVATDTWRLQGIYHQAEYLRMVTASASQPGDAINLTLPVGTQSQRMDSLGLTAQVQYTQTYTNPGPLP